MTAKNVSNLAASVQARSTSRRSHSHPSSGTPHTKASPFGAGSARTSSGRTASSAALHSPTSASPPSSPASTRCVCSTHLESNCSPPSAVKCPSMAEPRHPPACVSLPRCASLRTSAEPRRGSQQRSRTTHPPRSDRMRHAVESKIKTRDSEASRLLPRPWTWCSVLAAPGQGENGEPRCGAAGGSGGDGSGSPGVQRGRRGFESRGYGVAGLKIRMAMSLWPPFASQRISERVIASSFLPWAVSATDAPPIGGTTPSARSATAVGIFV